MAQLQDDLYGLRAQNHHLLENEQSKQPLPDEALQELELDVGDSRYSIEEFVATRDALPYQAVHNVWLTINFRLQL
jgi:hypothetical protein